MHSHKAGTYKNGLIYKDLIWDSDNLKGTWKVGESSKESCKHN